MNAEHIGAPRSTGHIGLPRLAEMAVRGVPTPTPTPAKLPSEHVVVAFEAGTPTSVPAKELTHLVRSTNPHAPKQGHTVPPANFIG